MGRYSGLDIDMEIYKVPKGSFDHLNIKPRKLKKLKKDEDSPFEELEPVRVFGFEGYPCSRTCWNTHYSYYKVDDKEDVFDYYCYVNFMHDSEFYDSFIRCDNIRYQITVKCKIPKRFILKFSNFLSLYVPSKGSLFESYCEYNDDSDQECKRTVKYEREIEPAPEGESELDPASDSESETETREESKYNKYDRKFDCDKWSGTESQD